VEDAVGFPIDSMPLNPSALFDLHRQALAGELPRLAGGAPESGAVGGGPRPPQRTGLEDRP